MQNIKLENTQPISLSDIVRHITMLQFEIGSVLSILIDEIYLINSQDDFDLRYKNDFDTIAAELKTDPRALVDPEKLKDIPARTKKLFMLIQTAQRLSPPKSDIQIIH